MKNEMEKIIFSYDPSKIVFWVGSGVDCNAPSNLPKAKELLIELLDLTCGEIYKKKVIDNYRDIHGGEPRLETVVAEIKIYERELKNNNSILEGFKTFLESPFNKCHETIAYYITQGANVITTNYGNAIPNAFNEIVKENDDKMVLSYDKISGMYCYKSKNKKYGQIYHIHGVSDNLNTLGISLEEVKNNLTKNFKNIIESWINDGFCFIFVGYSCSDSLDVNVMFDKLYVDSNSNSCGIIVNHTDEYSITNNIDPNYSIIKKYPKHYQFNINANAFFDKIRITNKSYVKNNDFNWKNEFENKCNMKPNENYKYIVLGYIRALGLDCKKILSKDWYFKIEKSDYTMFYRNWYINYHASCCLGNMGKNILSFYYGVKNNSDLQISDLFSNISLRKSSQVGEDTETILMNLRNFPQNHVIDWNISTPLNRRVQRIMFDVLLHPLKSKKILDKHYTLSKNIMECNDLIINYGNNCVQSFVQIITALRYNGVLSMLYKNDYKMANDLIKKAIYYYDQISSNDGLLVASIYSAFIEMINYKFNLKVESYSNCFEILKNVRSMLKYNHKIKVIILFYLIKINCYFSKILN